MTSLLQRPHYKTDTVLCLAVYNLHALPAACCCCEMWVHTGWPHSFQFYWVQECGGVPKFVSFRKWKISWLPATRISATIQVQQEDSLCAWHKKYYFKIIVKPGVVSGPHWSLAWNPNDFTEYHPNSKEPICTHKLRVWWYTWRAIRKVST